MLSQFPCRQELLHLLKQRSHVKIYVQLQKKCLPQKARKNPPEHKGPSSPIMAATPTFKHLVQPRDADTTEDAKVNMNKTYDWVSVSLWVTITDLRISPSPTLSPPPAFVNIIHTLYGCN